MIKTKYLILGAGPSGLSFANRLLQKGINDFLVIEAEATAGGLCRSVDVDGSPLDIGGGHILDVRNKRVNSFLFGFMPESEWDLYTRDSRIDMGDYVIGSPIEANIWQMPQHIQADYLSTIAEAGCNTGKEKPERFTDWILWKLGKRITEDYMLPYNQKMFGDNLNDLGTYWLEKLPNVSYEETLKSCQDHRPYGSQPGHAQFYYPQKFGYGEVWLRMAKALGGNIIYNTPVTELDTDKLIVNGEYQGEVIINTIPWTEFEVISSQTNEIDCFNQSNNLTDQVRQTLKYTSVVIDYYEDNIDSEAQWIYYPDLALDYHRILVRPNFCPNSKGYWTETNLNRFHKEKSEARPNSYYYICNYAYPLNTLDKPQFINNLLNTMKKKNIYGLGRWGEWQHFNSDVVVDRALTLADELTEI